MTKNIVMSYKVFNLFLVENKILIILLRIFLSLVLLFSFIGKLLTFSSFVTQIDSIIHLPSWLLFSTALIVLSIELLISISLITGKYLLHSSLLSALLLSIFTLVMVNQIILEKIPNDCGCFGTLISTPVNEVFFVRNGIFIVISIIIFYSECERSSL